MYKDILVYVDGSKSVASALDAATALARTHEARLVALHVTPPPFLTGDIGTGAMSDMIRWQEDQEGRLLAAADKLVATARQRSGRRIDWRADRGDILETIELHSRYADVIVIGRAARDDIDAVGSNYLPDALIMESARPVLIIPPNWTGKSVGEMVLVAWNRSREASRAIHDALPVLTTAKSVTVFEANPSAMTSPRVVGAEIGEHLAHHGIKPTIETVAMNDAEIARTMLSRAAALGADLIVAGAYGHSRLREYVLGGVTRDLLKTADIPVLMSH
jgi:nucleotide-binding universal stress UspA family protein